MVYDMTRKNNENEKQRIDEGGKPVGSIKISNLIKDACPMYVSRTNFPKVAQSSKVVHNGTAAITK